MNDKQKDAIGAAFSLFRGGLDYEDSIQYYRILYHYILNSIYKDPVSPIFKDPEPSD